MTFQLLECEILSQLGTYAHKFTHFGVRKKPKQPINLVTHLGLSRDDSVRLKFDQAAFKLLHGALLALGPRSAKLGLTSRPKKATGYRRK
jgi:hypothetical protein